MKNTVIALSIVFIGVFSALTSYVNAQTCILTKDSITSGPGAGLFNDYYYDSANKIIRVNRGFDTTTMFEYDTVYYNGAGQIDKIETYQDTNGVWLLKQTLMLAYGSGKINRIDATGVSKNSQNVWTAWAMSHDITYNSNDIQNITLDNSSIVGNPEGFPGSFLNMVWQGGNLTSFDLVVLTSTVPISVTAYDNNSNILDKGIITEVPDIFQMANLNNIRLAAAVNKDTLAFGTDTTFVEAGDTIIGRSYTYNSNNEVETLTELPSKINQSTSTTEYFYDYSSGINSPEYKSIGIYPNPANDFITIDNGFLSGADFTVRVLDYTGKEVKRQSATSNSSSLNIKELKPGMYFVEVVAGSEGYRGKFLKQ